MCSTETSSDPNVERFTYVEGTKYSSMTFGILR